MAGQGATTGGLGQRIRRRLTGWRRERRERAAIAASALFDPVWYRQNNPDVAASGADPLTHYVRSGADEGRRPSPWFDADWYLARNPDVAATGQNPLAHYVRFGAREGRDPNAVFSGRWYLANHPEAGALSSPLEHYVRTGAALLADPSPEMDARWYAEANPDRGGLDPLAHYLLIGRRAGLAPSPYGGASPPGAPVTAARLETLKPIGDVRGRTLALFVAHCPAGELKPNAGPYLEALVEAGVAVVLIAAADRPFALDPRLQERLAGAYARDNRGYDFAAWAHLMRAEPGLFAAETVLLLNDSLIGPSSVAALKTLLGRIEASPADVVGATDSREHGWHLQSFFVALKRRALSNVALHVFFGQVRSLDDKEQVIRAYEVRLAATLQAAGLACEALFPSARGDNRTVFDWRGLVGEGFPFVKTLTLRGAYADMGVDIEGWRETLGAAGFDLAVADATLARPGPVPAAGKTWPLVRQATAPSRPPWKVAFIGPWNYASGLGSASRGYLSALWRAGVRLNLRPIERPFHVHARLAPTLAVDEFAGAPDAVIVHLNPDSWQLLGEAERDLIDQARRRVGLWVWEMGALPPAWRPNFDRVDAVWAPSRYCAEVFAAEGARAVDVVPHVITAPPPQLGARAALLSGLGVDPSRRVVLYAFDGASYLVRKNPGALVRAFAAAGLDQRGWSLVLKAKHLMERAGEGAELLALARATPGVTVVDRALSTGEMAGLFAAADIYASPHRSEGFGLTVAEAMAQGKAVVASDFGGVRDFLDETTGWPAPARPVRLEQDFGHYGRGGVWGEPDEAAFAAALSSAADSVAAGDLRRGEAARLRIAERFSAEAVGATLNAALGRLMAGEGAR